MPSAWVVPIPDGLSTFEAMAIGTAGFTAALGLEALARNGTTPESGPVVVTGATGGVGCLAVDMFASAGYRVIAVTGKADQHDWLRALGAAEILPREAVSLADDPKPRPLLPTRWAGALDNVGGATLEALVRGTQIGGNVALCGLVGGADYRGTVLPFILRGVGLLGITSSNTPMPVRRRLWQRLATDLSRGTWPTSSAPVRARCPAGRDRSHARRPRLRPRRRRRRRRLNRRSPRFACPPPPPR